MVHFHCCHTLTFQLRSSYTDYTQTHKQQGAVGGAGEGLEESENTTFQSNPNRHRPLERRKTYAFYFR